MAPKPSFLLNERVYTKLTSERDQIWALNALESAGLVALTNMGTAWSLAAIYFVTNPKLSRKVRAAAKTVLVRVLIEMSPENRLKASEIIIFGMEEWIRQVLSEHKIC